MKKGKKKIKVLHIAHTFNGPKINFNGLQNQKIHVSLSIFKKNYLLILNIFKYYNINIFIFLKCNKKNITSKK